MNTAGEVGLGDLFDFAVHDQIYLMDGFRIDIFSAFCEKVPI